MSILSQSIILKKKKVIDDKQSTDRVYCTVDGVLTPVVFKSADNLYTTYDDLFVTSIKKLTLQQSLKGVRSLSRTLKDETTTTTTTAQGGTVTTTSSVTITPACVFDYHSHIKTEGSKISSWGSSFGSATLNQSTDANRPLVGRGGGGKAFFSPMYFSIYDSSFMSLNSAITLTGDFTILLYVSIIGHPVNKYMRFLGKSDDNNMYFSAGDVGDKSYKLSFDSSNSVTFDSSTFYYAPSSSPLLITVTRSKDQLTIRENGVEVGTQTCPTSDFVFDQFGRTGNIDLSFNGGLWHFSAYDGAISKSLTDIENAIIKSALQSKDV